jgi:hypothetical protein
MTGTAVDRTGPPPSHGGGYYIPGYYYGYYPYGYWGSGYGYGLGYFYAPFWSPFGYGYGYPGYGYGSYYGGYGDPYYGGGGGSSSYSREPRESGSLKLKIKPRDAQVYVDGYLVGDVDSFDGAFQKLGIDAGSHRIELKAEGYEPLQFDVLITPNETATYKGEMKRK